MRYIQEFIHDVKAAVIASIDEAKKRAFEPNYRC
jgi:hypothetical protein